MAVGNGNVVRDPDRTWLSEFGESNPTHYLFASAADTGDADVIWHTFEGNIHFPQFTSYDFDDKTVKGVFTTLLGSYQGDWNSRSIRGNESFTDPQGNPGLHPVDPNHPLRTNIIRSLLASDGDALVSTLYMPTWFSAMAATGLFVGDAPLTLGYPVSDGFRDGLNDAQVGRGFIVNELFGDPTVRMSVVKPPTNLRAQTLLNGSGQITGRRITWSAPVETGLLGYRLYRASSLDGPFAPIHTGLWTSPLSFDDPYTSTTPAYYMVRAVKTQPIPNTTDTYQNASQGVFAKTTAAQPSGQTFHFATTHEIPVQFDRNVQSALSNSDLILDNVTTQEQIPASSISLSNYNSTTNTATFSFINIEEPGYANETILPDGNYRATIAASDVVLNGEEMTNDMILNFFVLSGDANRTRTVNLQDFDILAANFGQSPRDFTQGDFDYDGVVNLSDFNILSGQFGTVLEAAPLGPDVISVSVLSPNYVEISWFDNIAGETGWRVQWTFDPTSFDPQNHIDIEGDPGNNLLRTESVGEFPDGRRVWFRIRAYSNPGGPNTAYSPKRGGTMLLPAPTNLQLSTPGDGVVDLAWSISTTQATRVFIQRSTNGFEWDTIHDQDSGILSYQDRVEPGTRYYYRVYLHNDAIDSAPSFIEQIVP